MAQTAVKMVNQSVEAYIDQNLGTARETIGLDDEMDGFFVRVRGQLVRRIARGEPDGEQALDLLMIAKYYERIGDHAVNVAEWAEFSVTGKHKGRQDPEDTPAKPEQPASVPFCGLAGNNRVLCF